MDPRYAEILIAAFAAASGFDVEDIQVEFTEDEEILVYVSGSGLWVMLIGCDDDGFAFFPAEAFDSDEWLWVRSDWKGSPIEFDYPEAWLRLEEENIILSI